MALEKEALEHLANEIEKVATWHGGARENHVRLLADQVRSVANGSHQEWFGDAKAQADALAEAEAKLAAERQAEADAQAAADAARKQAEERAAKTQ